MTGPPGVKGVAGPTGLQGLKGDPGSPGQNLKFKITWFCLYVFSCLLCYITALVFTMHICKLCPNFFLIGKAGQPGAIGQKGDGGQKGNTGPVGPSGTTGLPGTKALFYI